MATRATYTFHVTNVCREVCVHMYIHHDGYPSGASQYFRSMLSLLQEQSPLRTRALRGGPAEQFLRSNPAASVTSHPDNHLDTEFHYEVRQSGGVINLKAYEYDHERNRLQFFNGDLRDFIERYLIVEELFV